jgi:anthranilate/para-aminobenzoate synthase component II
VVVHRNDQVTVEDCLAMGPDHVVISPGPGDPSEAGISRDVIKAFAGKVPVLGVCLGHQCIYEVFGGVVTGAGRFSTGRSAPSNTMARAYSPAFQMGSRQHATIHWRARLIPFRQTSW